MHPAGLGSTAGGAAGDDSDGGGDDGDGCGAGGGVLGIGGAGAGGAGPDGGGGGSSGGGAGGGGGSAGGDDVLCTVRATVALTSPIWSRSRQSMRKEALWGFVATLEERKAPPWVDVYLGKTTWFQHGCH